MRRPGQTVIKVSLFFVKRVEIFSQISTIESVDRGMHGLAMHTPVFLFFIGLGCQKGNFDKKVLSHNKALGNEN